MRGGSIIGGRNLHILDNLVPVDESTWPKNVEDEVIQERIVENSDNSMISLAVKGSVVMGDVENTFKS